MLFWMGILVEEAVAGDCVVFVVKAAAHQETLYPEYRVYVQVL